MHSLASHVIVVSCLALAGCNGDKPTDPTPTPEPEPSSTGTTASTAQTADTSETGAITTDSAVEGPSNVLLVLIDDVSSGKVGVYGESPLVRTPVIDALAADGVWFANAWVAPVCSPTRALLQTGRYGRRTGYGSIVQKTDDDWVLPSTERLLPSFLPASYTSVMYGKWHLSLAGTPLDNGWTEWSGSRVNLQGINGNKASYYGWRKTEVDGTVTNTTKYATTDTTDDAIEALGRLAEPWLIHVSYNAPHTPLEVPPPDLHTFAGLTLKGDPVDIERAMTEALDTELGRLLAAIPSDVRERTTVIVLGDNGEPSDLREPGAGIGGKLQVVDGGVRVPFVIQGARVRGRGRSDALVHGVDVVPTVLELAGVDPSSVGVVFDGLSLVPVLQDPSLDVHETIWSERFEPNGAGPFTKADFRTMRDANYKVIRDEVGNKTTFHAYGPDHPEQGPDLLRGGAQLTPAEQAAFDRLRAKMEADYERFIQDLP